MLCLVPAQTKIRKGRRGIFFLEVVAEIHVFQERDRYQGMESNQKAKWGRPLRDLGLVKTARRL